ncbi:glutamate receptor ionotropic, kainate 1-like [Macrobrachium nipponense]|uniref:glutamate receptor ionotropic, kainate 1-like n=1 Tax=Macrobrachium nipponense TaxID=159736 RepID=UPI0030C7E095
MGARSIFSRGLNGLSKLNVACLNFQPHMDVRKIYGNGVEAKYTYSGPALELLKIIANDMNFTYTLKVPPNDGAWGVLYPNGTWNGIIRMILDKEADIGLGPFGVTYVRSKFIDYTTPLLVDYTQNLGRRGNTEVALWSVLLALDPSVWIATFVMLAMTFSIVYLLDKSSSRVTSKISLLLRPDVSSSRSSI